MERQSIFCGDGQNSWQLSWQGWHGCHGSFAAPEAAAILTVERGSLLMVGVGQGGGRV